MLPASSGQRPGTLLNTLQCAGCRTVPTTKSGPAPNGSSDDKPCFVLKTSPGVGSWISHPANPGASRACGEERGLISPSHQRGAASPNGHEVMTHQQPHLSTGSHTLQRSWPELHAKVPMPQVPGGRRMVTASKSPN